MIVGVPKETKDQEFRVGLTPEAVREYVSKGHKVVVQSRAGEGVGATDVVYREAGAEIAATIGEVFERARLIIKVKEPQPAEIGLLKRHHLLFTYLHLAANRALTEGLLASECAAIAYETVTDPAGRLPLLAPMSEVAGRLSIEAAAQSLQKHFGGRGMLLGGIPGVPSANVLILGGGVVGVNAAKMAVGRGASVTLLDVAIDRLRLLDDQFGGRLRTRLATRKAFEEEVLSADVVIGAALVRGASAPRLVSKRMLPQMKRQAVLVDVSIDQGGCFETSRATTHAAPTFEEDGVIHYCVTNMPGSVPITSSFGLSNATLPYGLALAEKGLAALRDRPGLKDGLNALHGQLVCEPVALSLGMRFTDPATQL